MGMKRSEGGVLFWVFLFLISNNLIIIPLVSATKNTFQDVKTYYSPPHTPSGSHHRHHHVSPTPSSGGHVSCGDPPPSSPPPSHGGGGCACPTPPTPSGGHHGGSGGYYPPTPQTPYLPPVVPSPPYDPPVTVSPPSHGGYYGPPSSPLVPSPPIITPAPPLVPIITPAPPFTPVPFDPNSPPFPCTYWGSHPGLIFGVVGWWATVGGLFGVPTLPGLTPLPGLTSPSDYTVQQLLNNPRKDPYTSLYREASASFLNSMATRNFPFTSNQVRDSLLSSLGSEKAAAKQARVFRLANEGKLKVQSNRGQP